jgi:hypothetical protein
MSGTDQTGQGSTLFDRFLYASVGEDAQGNDVSVLSALARLQLDPWTEAADLSGLPRDGARLRLAGLLTPPGEATVVDAGLIARLIDLLPQTRRRAAAPPDAGMPTAPRMRIGLILGAVAVTMILYQVFVMGSTYVGY